MRFCNVFVLNLEFSLFQAVGRIQDLTFDFVNEGGGIKHSLNVLSVEVSHFWPVFGPISIKITVNNVSRAKRTKKKGKKREKGQEKNVFKDSIIYIGFN